MRISYDPDGDVLLITLRDGQPVEGNEITEDLILHTDAEGNPLQIEILDAKRVLNAGETLKVEIPTSVVVLWGQN